MDIRYQKLRDEIIKLGLVGKSDLEIADLLNQKGLYGDTKLRGVISTNEIFEAITLTEYDALTATEKERCKLLLSLQQIDVSKTNIQDAFKKMFAAATQTRTNLLALTTVSISKAEALGFGGLTHEDVIKSFRENIRKYKAQFSAFPPEMLSNICLWINENIKPSGMTYMIDIDVKKQSFRLLTLGELPNPFEEVI